MNKFSNPRDYQVLDHQQPPSEWNSVIAQQQKGMQLRPLPQHTPSPVPHLYNYEQERDGLEESHHIATTLAFLDDDEAPDTRCAGNTSQSGTNGPTTEMYLWSSSTHHLNNNNNDTLQHNFNRDKPLNGHTKDMFCGFDYNNAFNATDGFKTNEQPSFNGFNRDAASYNVNKSTYYNGYTKQNWDTLTFSQEDLNKSHNGPTLGLPNSQPTTSAMGNNHSSSHNAPHALATPAAYSENDGGMLSPQLPINSEFLDVYRLLQESREHAPSLLDLLVQTQQTQNSRAAEKPNEQHPVPIMNLTVPPPPLVSNHQREQRPRGTLADNKPFPASLAKQVRSSGPPHQVPPRPQVMEESEMLARQFQANMSLGKGQDHREPHPGHLMPPPPAPPRCYPYFPGPMMHPHFSGPHAYAMPQPNPFINPYYSLARAQKKMSNSQRLYAVLEVCYEQFRQLEKERKQTEARLASSLPGRHWSSANTLPVPKLPPSPTRVDRLIIDNIREHCRLLTLIGKMEHLGAYKVPLTVHLAISQWKSAVQRVEDARRAELEAHKLNHNLLVFRGPAAAGLDDVAMEEKVENLVTSIRQLFTGIRGARTACWATLTCTVLSVKEKEDSEKVAKNEEPIKHEGKTTTNEDESQEIEN